MKRRITWFDRLMTAITFAEANDHDTAKKMLGKPESLQHPKAQTTLKPLTGNAIS